MIVAAIPAYNEEKTIAKIILQAQKHVDKVLVVDDGSTDMTAEIAARLGAIVVKHRENMGKGAALKTIFNSAKEIKADVLVTLDADGQHNPDEIPRIVKPIFNGEADIVIGSRLLDKAMSMEIPMYRRVGIKILNRLTNLLSGRKITDTQSGYRGYSSRVLRELQVVEGGFGVDSQILIEAVRKGFKIMEVPVTCTYRGGETSTKNPVFHSAEVLLSLIRLAGEEHPLLFFAIPGLITVAAGLIGLVNVVQIYFTIYKLATGTLLLSMLLVLIGTFSFFTGIILYIVSRLIRRLEQPRSMD